MASESESTAAAGEPHPEPASTLPPPRLSDFMQDLLWPRLLRATPLALRASRVGLAFFLLVVVAAIGMIPQLWAEPGTEPFLAFAFERKLEAFAMLVAGDPATGEAPPWPGFRALLVDLPAALFDRYPVSTVPLMIAMVVVVARLAGAISRSAACEFALGRTLSWRDAMAFSLGRWLSLIGVVILPGLIVGLLALALLVAGKLLFSIAGISIVGAVLYVLALLAGLVAVLFVAAWILGGVLLVPAVTCEGVDALDGVERAFALVFGQPLRLVVYLAILGTLGGVSIGAVWLVGAGTIAFTETATTAWTGAHAEAIFGPVAPEEAGWLTATARSIVGFWESVVWLFVGAFAVSYIYTGSTVLYLLLRQADTGQEHTEIWQPGMIEGVMAQTIEARAALNEGES